MRDVEHGGAAVSAMREQEAAGRFQHPPAAAVRRDRRAQPHGERHARERVVHGRIGDERRQRRVGLVYRVSEAAGDVEAGAIAAGRGHRQASRREDDRIGVDRRVTFELDHASARPLCASRRVRGGCRRRSVLNVNSTPTRARVGDERVAHGARLIRDGEQLAGLLFERERQSQRRLEERPLFGERPRPQEVAHRVRRRIRHEPFGRQRRRQHVASAAAADQDLASAVARAFDDEHAPAVARREDGRHQPGRAGADDDDER